MTAPRIYINGVFAAPGEARMSAFDRGALLGEGVFESLRAYGGRPFLLGDHLDRLTASSAALGLPWPVPCAELPGAIERLLADAGGGDRYIRITLTRGNPDAPFGLNAPPTLTAYAQPLPAHVASPPPGGWTVIDSPIRRGPNEVAPRHKTTSYLPLLLARSEARRQGADEALIFDAGGALLEGTASNLFAIIGGAVVTPPLAAPILPGVSRAFVLRRCAALGLAAREAPLGPEAIDRAEALFATNSLMGIVPICRWIGRRAFDTAAPPLPALLRDYRHHTTGDTP